MLRQASSQFTIHDCIILVAKVLICMNITVTVSKFILPMHTYLGIKQSALSKHGTKLVSDLDDCKGEYPHTFNQCSCKYCTLII